MRDQEIDRGALSTAARPMNPAIIPRRSRGERAIYGAILLGAF